MRGGRGSCLDGDLQRGIACQIDTGRSTGIRRQRAIGEACNRRRDDQLATAVLGGGVGPSVGTAGRHIAGSPGIAFGTQRVHIGSEKATARERRIEVRNQGRTSDGGQIDL